jgi:hypothetical protein
MKKNIFIILMVSSIILSYILNTLFLKGTLTNNQLLVSVVLVNILSVVILLILILKKYLKKSNRMIISSILLSIYNFFRSLELIDYNEVYNFITLISFILIIIIMLIEFKDYSKTDHS